MNVPATAFAAAKGMFVTDANGIIISVNQMFTSITGYAPEEVIGKTPGILNSGRHNKDFYVSMWDSVNRLGFWEGGIWNRRKNGEVYAEVLSITAALDQNGKVRNYVATLADIPMANEAADQINP